MLGIALDFGGAAVFDGDQDAASVWAVVRAGGVDDALHLPIIRSIRGSGSADLWKRTGSHKRVSCIAGV